MNKMFASCEKIHKICIIDNAKKADTFVITKREEDSSTNTFDTFMEFENNPIEYLIDLPFIRVWHLVEVLHNTQ